MADFDAAQFIKIVGMLGSDQDGEVLNVARTATKFLKNANLSWGDVIAPVTDKQLLEQISFIRKREGHLDDKARERFDAIEDKVVYNGEPCTPLERRQLDYWKIGLTPPKSNIDEDIPF